jgi:hypothetical protein
MDVTEPALSPIILLDRVKKGFRPDYCLHGQAHCVRCHQWVHLGHDTSKVVESGGAQPLCMDCVQDLIKRGEWPADARPAERVVDHKRADGPHEDFTPPEGWVETDCANPRCPRMVWTPPIDDEVDGVPVMRVCSPACADDVRRDLDRDSR